LYFYELHEGDEDVFSDLLLVHDELIAPEEFFELVMAVRAQVKDSYEDDSLIEAIARELEREHGFTFVSDERIAASVHVSLVDGESQVISLDDDDSMRADYRAVLADFDPDAGELN
jgi:hypothetical protein